MSFPFHVEEYAIICVGIHGAPTAWKPAERSLKKRRRGRRQYCHAGKSNIVAKVSGNARGVVGNSCLQSGMRRLMAHSVEAWESNSKTLPTVSDLDCAGDGSHPRVIFADIDPELSSTVDCFTIVDEMQGSRHKPGYHFGDIQDGAPPHTIDTPVYKFTGQPIWAFVIRIRCRCRDWEYVGLRVGPLLGTI